MSGYRTWARVIVTRASRWDGSTLVGRVAFSACVGLIGIADSTGPLLSSDISPVDHDGSLYLPTMGCCSGELPVSRLYYPVPEVRGIDVGLLCE